MGRAARVAKPAHAAKPAVPAGGGGAWIAAGVFAAALIVRLTYLAQVRGTPITTALLIDSETYDRFARRILAGTFRGEEVYAVNLLYPYALAALYALGKGSVLFALHAQAVLDALTCALAAWIGVRLFGRAAGAIAGLLCALSGSLVFYAGALLTPTLATALGTAMLAALVAWRASPRARWLLLAGSCAGFATLARGNSLLFVPLALPCCFLPGRGRVAGLRAFGLLALAALAPLAAFAVRNFLASGQWAPVAVNYAAFYVGHNPDANGLYVLPRWAASGEFAHEVGGVRDALARELGRTLTLAQAAQWLFQEGVRWMLAHPAAEAKLAWTKFRYFWNAIDAPTNLGPYFAREWSPLLRVLPVGIGWLVPTGLVGAWWARGRASWALHAWGLVALATCLLFFVSAEYRLPAFPVLALFTGVFVTRVGAALAARDAQARRRRIELLALVPLAWLAFDHPPALVAQTRVHADYAKFGTLYARRGDLRGAQALFTRATALAPDYAPAWQGLAAVLEREGDTAGALAAARRASALGAGSIAPYSERAAAAALADSGLAAAEKFGQGDVQGALADFTRYEAAARAAGDTALALSLLNNVGLCRYRLGRLDEAADAFTQVLARRPDALKTLYNLGRVRAAQGRRGDAEAAFRQALALDPNAPGVRAALDSLAAGKPVP